MTPLEAAELLKKHDHYLILTHVRPDGDTIGCAAGLCRSLRQAGKEAFVLHNPEATSLFTPYLEGLVAPEGYEPETVVAVDMAARGLFPDNAKRYLERVELTIDHHPSQEFYAKHTCLDAKRAACGELMYEIVQHLGPITPEMGEALYVAVSTDCGCFVYSNTTPATHRVAAALMETGFDPYPVNRRHFRTKSFKRLKIEGMLASGMELRDGGETALVFLTLDMLQQVGADERDIDDISAFVGQVEGVKNGITLRELKPGVCKLSLRTDPGDLNASAVCAILGGGGHAAAAGATVEGTMEEVRKAVLAAIETVRKG
ncbi:DHH family phosphoesterase [Lawsonibacter sp. LCP25S3_G6]|uniref:DHH family phosphoesterase n=1 Tax=unclassified Lawsonibacter TaxID=2617946 RepID=UPI003F9C9F31